MVESTEQYSAVLIGSSGGGTATLGHTNPIELLNTVHKELCHLHSDEDVVKVCAGLSHAIFVSMCDGSGFDSVKKDDWLPGKNTSVEAVAPVAKLYSVGFHNKNADSEATAGRINVHTMKGPLSEINAEAKRLDATLSRILRNNYALISVSSEPTIIHANSLRSCSKLSIPVTGSGGTSISQIAELHGLPIIGAQGSVASTTNTKAKGWAMGLAREWGMMYDPKHNYQDDSSDYTSMGQEITPLPSLKSILEAALPSFLFVCIALRFLSASLGDGKLSMIAEIEYVLRYIVPGTTCSILAATSLHSSSTSQSQDQSTILLSSALAGILASASASQLDDNTIEGGSALAGLIAGASIPPTLSAVSNLCVKYHITATMTNIVCGGGVGMMVGMIMHLSGAAYALSIFTGLIRCLIQFRRIKTPETNVVANVFVYLQKMWYDFGSQPSMSNFVYAQDLQSNEWVPIPRGLGFGLGCIFVYGSKIGWYHSIFLPLIMLEMDSSTGQNAASLLGAIDECTLVMICAGICAGNLVPPRMGGNTSLSWQALKTNILCGDFIEACYPSMEKSRLINFAAYLAAGISTEIIVCRRLLSSAYMPLPLSILISKDRWGMSVASSIAFGISFVGTIMANMTDSITKKSDDKRKE